jgi:hypothetical protein
MRLTVGPLPAAVYWRRRAVVLGAVLLLALAVSYTCSGPESAALPRPSSSASVKTSPKSSPGLQPANLISPTAQTGGVITSPTTVPPVVDSIDPGACTDAEIRVTAKPVATSVHRGDDLLIYILIKNVSNRTCTRDIGPDLQELRIVEGADKIWSSDDCGTARGSNVRSFQPNFEVSFNVDWNGKLSSSCTGTGSTRAPAGPTPEAGRYQVLGRVGTAQSKPATLTIS